MPDSPVENRQPPDYPHEMETRVAILEHSTAELKFEIREVKTMVRDLATEMREGFRAINAKFDATDKAIADLRVDNQTLRTELQTGLYSNLRWTVGTILGFGTLGIAIIGLLIKFH
ncbi:CCDC90 family protein [Acidiphilium multivorum]|jgi:predicted phage-related endonuclease|uniref:hypothetical protein n=1 Tax=Acidiphilium multivorum TaxID=62140 RepID=UPI001B8B2463|nr:hypothetical protein [Acidiphilium multivorum]MBS3025420.1 hypothetical protein [Acidiphilium multivorum]